MKECREGMSGKILPGVCERDGEERIVVVERA